MIDIKHLDINNFNTWTKKHIFYDNKFDKDGFIIMENNSNYKSTGIIAKIFEDHWDVYYSKYKNTVDLKRSNANKEIQKVIDCANHNLDASVYVCPKDDEVIFSHHTCKGKLCNKLITIVKKEKIPFMRSMLKWKNSILTSFNRIPIKCPKCGSLMKLCFDVT